MMEQLSSTLRPIRRDGVALNGRVYDSPALDTFSRTGGGRGQVDQAQLVVRHDPEDPARASVRLPGDPSWHVLQARPATGTLQ